MEAHHVLEFTLGDEHYCLDSEYVSVIVNRSWYEMTSISDAPPHIEGTIIHRNDTVTIVDPHEEFPLAVADDDREKLIIFTDEWTADERIGWAVTDVTGVSTIDPENIDETNDETTNGIVTRDERRLIWTVPSMVEA